MWEYICPKCRKEVKKNSHECPHCGEKYPLAIRVPPTFLSNPKKLEAYVHKHVFPRISEFERNYLKTFFTEYFSDDFESGTLLTTDVPAGKWTAGENYPAIVTSPVHHGTYAVQLHSGWAANLRYVFPSTNNETFLRYYVQFDALPVSGETLELGGLTDDGDIHALASIVNTGGIIRWNLYSVTDSYAYVFEEVPDITPTANQWHCIGIWFKQYTLNGAKLWIDGVLGLTTVYTTIDKSNYQIRLYVYSPTSDILVTYDCVIAGDVYYGPETNVRKGTIAIHAKLAGII